MEIFGVISEAIKLAAWWVKGSSKRKVEKHEQIKADIVMATIHGDMDRVNKLLPEILK